MTARKRRPTHSARESARPAARTWRPWLLACAVALLVARVLVPSEGVAWLGDGQAFGMLWLVVATLWSLVAVEGERLAFRLSWVDLTVLLLVICSAASALLNFESNPRPSINMLWEWIGLGISYFLARALISTPREMRAVVAVMIALAAIESVYGVEQVFFSMPADRAAYEADPDEVLRDAGQWYPPDSPERKQFEDRLFSPEPLGTFALANTLAGYLATWIAVAMAILADRSAPGAPYDGARFRRSRLALLGCALLGSWCLWLTHSRSAILALALGAGVLAALRFVGRASSPVRRLAIAAAALVLLVAGLALVAVPQLAAGAIKSLEYRLEYWKSTLAMVRDHPWLGVGPGSFQDFYTAYKLPQASEEVRDPHNFILEVWATAGTPAVVALLAVLVAYAVHYWRGKNASPAGDEGSPHGARLIFGGAAAGVVLAYYLGSLIGLELGSFKLLTGLAVGSITVWLLAGWVDQGELPSMAAPLGVGVLLVHLLAAGGITYPALANSFWLLMAISVNQTSPPADVTAPRKRWVAPALLLVSIALTGACYWTGYGPVLRSRTALAEADAADDRSLDRIRLLTAAAEADAWSADPWRKLAELHLARWKRQRDPITRHNFEDSLEKSIALRPSSSAALRLAGDWMLEVYELTGNAQDAQVAAKHYRRAVELYPTSAVLHAQLATSLAASGDTGRAKEHARESLRLDALTPHADKKLNAQTRERMREIADSPKPRRAKD